MSSPPSTRADVVVHEADPYNAEPTPAALAQAPITPAGLFYSRNHGTIQDIDVASWSLTVDGLVEHPLRLGLDELKARFAPTTVTATLQCAGNRRAGLIEVRDIPGEAPWGPGATSTAAWTGVRLADVLAAATPVDAAEHVCFEAPDVAAEAAPPQRYGSSIPLAKASGGEVLLAWEMNGQPLEPLHGAPLRAVVPGYIGARSVKWLERITLSEQPSDNFFQATAYRLLTPEQEPATGLGIPLEEVALNSAVLTPADGAQVASGPLTVTGYAYAGGDRTVERVDVTVDGGRTWTQADLGDDQGEWAWRMWSARVDLQPGQVEVAARAWDSAAATQPEHAATVWNPKGYVNNSWPRITLHVR